MSSHSCYREARGIFWLILLESESCPLVSEPCGVGVLCVGEVVDGENWLLLSDPSLSWFPLSRPAPAAEASACSAGGDGCFGDRCLFSSTALPTAKRPQTAGFPSALQPFHQLSQKNPRIRQHQPPCMSSLQVQRMTFAKS